jgi:hypothetical protein
VAKFGGDLCNGRLAGRLLSSPDPPFEFEMLRQGKVLIVDMLCKRWVFDR